MGIIALNTENDGIVWTITVAATKTIAKMGVAAGAIAATDRDGHQLPRNIPT